MTMDAKHQQLFHIFATQFVAMLEEYADQLETDDDMHASWVAIRHLADGIKREEGMDCGPIH